MTSGVLMYCFDTPKTNYHKLLERCVSQVKRYLDLEVTVVTNMETFKKIKHLGMVNYKLVEQSRDNTRSYRGKNVPWYNRERVCAYEHSPYDTTILMDCDYFIFSRQLLEIIKTDFDVMLHDKVHDLTGQHMIEGTDEATLPLVWATVVLFRKNPRVEMLFETIKHVQKHYGHYRDLYRIKYTNYRNDYVFAIALHQLNMAQRMPTPMAMLADRVSVLDSDQSGIAFAYDGKINFTRDLDVHVLDKEWCDV